MLRPPGGILDASHHHHPPLNLPSAPLWVRRGENASLSVPPSCSHGCGALSPLL